MLTCDVWFIYTYDIYQESMAFAKNQYDFQHKLFDGAYAVTAYAITHWNWINNHPIQDKIKFQA